MSFVTDEMVEVAARALCVAYWSSIEDVDRRAGSGDDDWKEFEPDARAALTAAAPLWLAHVRAASEHTADYQMAEACRAALKALAAEPNLTRAEQIAQAARCSCRGSDVDWCVCQNSPDAETIAARIAAMKGATP